MEVSGSRSSPSKNKEPFSFWWEEKLTVRRSGGSGVAYVYELLQREGFAALPAVSKRSELWISAESRRDQPCKPKSARSLQFSKVEYSTSCVPPSVGKPSYNAIQPRLT